MFSFFFCLFFDKINGNVHFWQNLLRVVMKAIKLVKSFLQVSTTYIFRSFISKIFQLYIRDGQLYFSFSEKENQYVWRFIFRTPTWIRKTVLMGFNWNQHKYLFTYQTNIKLLHLQRKSILLWTLFFSNKEKGEDIIPINMPQIEMINSKTIDQKI